MSNGQNINLSDWVFLTRVNDTAAGIKRAFLGSKEIKSANSLVKKGLIEKGIMDEKGSGVFFYPNRKGLLYEY